MKEKTRSKGVLHRGLVAVLWAVLLILIWIIAGSLLYGASYPAISPETQAAIAETSFCADEGGTAGDRVMLLEKNTDALTHRLRLIDSAKERIILSSFDFREDYSGTDVLSSLLAASERGVQIQILVDGMPGFLKMMGRPLFLALESRDNVEIRLYNPIEVSSLLTPWKLQCRLHDKYLIIDDTACILGGRNTYDYFLGSYDSVHENCDREVLTYCAEGNSETIRQVEAYFDDIWNQPCSKDLNKNADEKAGSEKVQKSLALLREHYAGLQETYPEAYTPYDYLSESLPAEKITLVYGSSAPEKKEPVVLETLTQLMEGAQDRVLLHTPYAVCDRYMNDCLRRVAGAADTTLLVNNVLGGGNLPASGDYLWLRDDILDTGVNLLEFNGGKSYHGKSIVVDDHLSVIGSFNYDMRSVYLDTELMLVIDSEEFCRVLTAEMEKAQAQCLGIGSDAKNFDMLAGEAKLSKKLQILLMGILAPFIRRLI